MNDFDTEKYESAIEETPEEVRAFLWSDEFKKMTEELAKYFSLDESKKKVLEESIFENIIGFSDKEASEEALNSLGLGEEKKSELITYVYEYFIQPTLNATAKIAEIEKKEEPETPQTTIQAQALSGIQERLSQGTIITPTKRDYSIEKPQEAPSAPKPFVPDPYRELPEK